MRACCYSGTQFCFECADEHGSRIVGAADNIEEEEDE
jgi:hypothetical protein